MKWSIISEGFAPPLAFDFSFLSAAKMFTSSDFVLGAIIATNGKFSRFSRYKER